MGGGRGREEEREKRGWEGGFSCKNTLTNSPWRIPPLIGLYMHVWDTIKKRTGKD